MADNGELFPPDHESMGWGAMERRPSGGVRSFSGEGWTDCVCVCVNSQITGTDGFALASNSSDTTTEPEPDAGGEAGLLPALPGGRYHQSWRHHWRDCRPLLRENQAGTRDPRIGMFAHGVPCER